MRWQTWSVTLFFMLAFAALPLNVWAEDTENAVKITRDTAPSASGFQLTEVAQGFFHPLYVTHAGDGSNRLFVVQQDGEIWILKDGVRSETPFLDVSHLVSTIASSKSVFSERGLLGLAFHPDYAANGRLYISYTDRIREGSVIEQYLVAEDDPDRVNLDSVKRILYQPQPTKWHNGGHITFGPDGYLYIGLGDGGTIQDLLGFAQSRQTLFGSILRIDIDGAEPYAIPPDNPFVGDPAALDEIWAYGLRNPWRFSFDRLTGDLYLGDVGELSWEEINFQPADSQGGENYGWNVWEGNEEFAGGEAPNYSPPIFVHGHAHGCAVTGGYVYRGGGVPELEAVYLLSDYCSGRIWGLWRDAHDLNWRAAELMHTEMPVSSFGEDEAGEIYVINYNGTIYRIDPAGA